MRGAELFLALPWLYLLLGVRALLPLHIGTVQAFFLLVAIIGTVGWVRPARIIRGVVLSARERGFVLAARGFGAEVRVNSKVSHVLTENGRVVGVALGNGDEIRASTIVSTLHPRTAFLDQIGEPIGHVEPQGCFAPQKTHDACPFDRGCPLKGDIS